MLRNSESLILGPRNLDKIFENKQIVQDSENLFVSKNFWTDKKPNTCTNLVQEQTQDVPTYEKRVSEILTAIHEETGRQNSDKVILKLLQDLYNCLDKNNLFASKVNSKLKIQILKCLYKQVESQNEEILLEVARIILEVCIMIFLRA